MMFKAGFLVLAAAELGLGGCRMRLVVKSADLDVSVITNESAPAAGDATLRDWASPLLRVSARLGLGSFIPTALSPLRAWKLLSKVSSLVQMDPFDAAGSLLKAAMAALLVAFCAWLIVTAIRSTMDRGKVRQEMPRKDVTNKFGNAAEGAGKEDAHWHEGSATAVEARNRWSSMLECNAVPKVLCGGIVGKDADGAQSNVEVLPSSLNFVPRESSEGRTLVSDDADGAQGDVEVFRSSLDAMRQECSLSSDGTDDAQGDSAVAPKYMFRASSEVGNLLSRFHAARQSCASANPELLAALPG